MSLSLLVFFEVFPHKILLFWSFFCNIDPLGSLGVHFKDPFYFCWQSEFVIAFLASVFGGFFLLISAFLGEFFPQLMLACFGLCF